MNAIKTTLLSPANYLAFKTILLTVCLCFGLMTLVPEPFLSTWLAMFFIACVPAQVLMGIWQDQDNSGSYFGTAQPKSGFTKVFYTILFGLALLMIVFYTVGGGSHDPKPPMMHYLIMSVVMTFWFAIIWQAWPLSLQAGRLKDNRWLSALAFLFVCFALAYILFKLFFNFSFLEGTGLYVPGIDPQGFFNAWYSVSFAVTTVAVIFTLVLFDFWPIRKYVSPENRFLWGLSSTILILMFSCAIYGLFVIYLAMDPVIYLVHGPVSYIFGVFVPLNLFEGKLFLHKSPPQKGCLLVLISAFAGFLLNQLYFVVPELLGFDLVSGAPSYELELWIANAMLAFSFPILVILTDHLQFWPLRQTIIEADSGSIADSATPTK